MAPVDPHPDSPASPARPRVRKPRPLARRLAALGAAVLLVAGLAVFLTPVPFGAVMIGLALVVLVRVSPTARLLRRGFARRYPASARRLETLRLRVRDYLRR